MSPTLDGPPFCPKCGYQEAPAPGADDEPHTMFYDASDFDLVDGSAPADAAATNVMPAVQARPPLGGRRPRVPGESIFAPEMRLEPGPEDKTPGGPLRVAPLEGGAPSDQSSATVDAPAVKATAVRRSTKAAGAGGPLRDESLFLPRCRECNRPLELEEQTLST